MGGVCRDYFIGGRRDVSRPSWPWQPVCPRGDSDLQRVSRKARCKAIPNKSRKRLRLHSRGSDETMHRPQTCCRRTEANSKARDPRPKARICAKKRRVRACASATHISKPAAPAKWSTGQHQPERSSSIYLHAAVSTDISWKWAPQRPFSATVDLPALTVSSNRTSPGGIIGMSSARESTSVKHIIRFPGFLL